MKQPFPDNYFQLSQHDFNVTPHQRTFIRRAIQNRLRAMLNHPVEEMMQAGHLLIYNKKIHHAGSEKRTRNILVVLGDYINPDASTYDMNRALDFYTYIIGGKDQSMATRKEAARCMVSVLKRHKRPTDIIDALAPAVGNYRYPRELRRYMFDMMSCTWLAGMKEDYFSILCKACLSFLDAGVPTSDDEHAAIGMLECINDKTYGSTVVFKASAELLADSGLIDRKAHARLVTLVMKSNAADQYQKQFEMGLNLLKGKITDPVVLSSIADLFGYATQKYDVYPQAIRATPSLMAQVENMPTAKIRADTRKAMFDKVSWMGRPNAVWEFTHMGYWDQKPEPTLAQIVALKDSFAEVSTHEVLNPKIKRLYALGAATLEKYLDHQRDWDSMQSTPS